MRALIAMSFSFTSSAVQVLFENFFFQFARLTDLVNLYDYSVGNFYLLRAFHPVPSSVVATHSALLITCLIKGVDPLICCARV